MSDVAREAGVSLMTVSRALKPGSRIAQATRQRVLEVVDRLGYVPNLGAGALASRRSGFVALMVPSLNNPHFAETLIGMKRVLEPEGMQVLVGFTNYQSAEEERVIDSMLMRRPEAIVLTYDGHTQQARRKLEASGIPVIEIWEVPSQPIGHVVGFSNRKAARDMTRALLDLGYRKIGYLGEAQDKGTRGSFRRRGWVDAMNQAGLSTKRQIACSAPPVGMAQGKVGFAQLMTRWPDTEAVLCVSDPCAFGALSHCLDNGWKVPERVAIAGFGAFEVSACCVPAISTLMVSGMDIGERTGDLILQLLRTGSRTTQHQILVAATPQLRASTGLTKSSTRIKGRT